MSTPGSTSGSTSGGPFDAQVVAAVCAHMNDDHGEDSLRIARAFGRPGATAARMTGLDADAGTWQVEVDGTTEELAVPWPAGPISERAEIRREVVALHEEACSRLGVEATGH